MVYLQVDLICEGDSEGNGVKVTPRIGYNCHNILMEKMEKLVEASSGCEGQYLAVYNQNLKIYLYFMVVFNMMTFTTNNHIYRVSGLSCPKAGVSKSATL